MKKSPSLLTGINVKAALIISIMAVSLLAAFFIYRSASRSLAETRVLRTLASRLKANSRKAALLITDVTYDEQARRLRTGIKFTEYDVDGQPLSPRYFHFDGNVIQLQSLTMRFTGLNIKHAKSLRDKSAYLFWKAFVPDGKITRSLELTGINEIPRGYKIKGTNSPDEIKLWKTLWKYSLDPEKAGNIEMKNAKIDASGQIFIPGTMYTLQIGQDGGMTIDSKSLPGTPKTE